MSYLERGQFRYVKGGYDGESTYQCMWCKKTICINDDPAYWNFCPICGKSWFQRYECRERNVPRWYYERFGNYASGDTTIKLASGKDELARNLFCPKRLKPTSQWVIEILVDLRGPEGYPEDLFWSVQERIPKISINQSLDIKRRLVMLRNDRCFPEDKFRARLEKIK